MNDKDIAEIRERIKNMRKQLLVEMDKIDIRVEHISELINKLENNGSKDTEEE